MREKQSFEEDIKRLQKIVEELTGGKLTLGESLKKYEEGIKLAQECSAMLNAARRKVELLIKKDGKYSLEKFDDSESQGAQGN
ncbi:MAG: exodeoxyribonuclease VII small subunit [Candidatus Omnitrophica bacterium]|nr:exodeoxyribonuclease VII small subunit [Candidatus Omnitrophota bacterium]MBU4473005.1 exodeoxyribonuclease VII small subunit [Candidatus Omnitrophota bacterium]MCG2706821.1 exodeoxyribonuclease VII small subunit [Candidatus Omnitrophota bacterium]